MSLNASKLLRQAAALFSLRPPMIPGTAPKAYAPGNYVKENAVLIEQTEFYLYMERLWKSEAEEAENPDRKMQCLDLAAAYRRVYDLQHDFYSRWQLSEDDHDEKT